MSIISSKVKEDYQKEYDEYLRIKSIILDEQEQPQLTSDQYSLVDLGLKVIAKFRNSTTEFEKPVYENIKNKLSELSISKKELMHDYVFLKEKLLFSSSVNVSQEDKIKFKELTDKINEVERQKLQMLLDESKSKSELESEKTKLETSMIDYIDTRKRLFNQTINYDDDITRKEMMGEYVSKYNSYFDDVFYFKKKRCALSNFKTLTENYMKHKPQILQSGDSTVTLDTKVKKTKKTNKKIKDLDNKLKTTLKDDMKKKKKNNNKTNEQEEKNSAEIKKILKESLTKMLFKTMNECESSKRTQSYFMSKEEIIKIIKDNPKLNKKIGTNLTKLSKKELCHKILS